MEKKQPRILSVAVKRGSRGDTGLFCPKDILGPNGIEDQKGSRAVIFPLMPEGSKIAGSATAGSNFASPPMDRENISQNSQNNVTTSIQTSTNKMKSTEKS